jgi:hypothetical protein
MSTAASLEYPAGIISLSFLLTLYTLALQFAKRYCERVSQDTQSVAASANNFGDPRVAQSRLRLSSLASREINARRSDAKQRPRGLELA